MPNFFEENDGKWSRDGRVRQKTKEKSLQPKLGNSEGALSNIIDYQRR